MRKFVCFVLARVARSGAVFLPYSRVYISFPLGTLTTVGSAGTIRLRKCGALCCRFLFNFFEFLLYVFFSSRFVFFRVFVLRFFWISDFGFCFIIFWAADVSLRFVFFGVFVLRFFWISDFGFCRFFLCGRCPFKICFFSNFCFCFVLFFFSDFVFGFSIFLLFPQPPVRAWRRQSSPSSSPSL